jgi:hypothetical protein
MSEEIRRCLRPCSTFVRVFGWLLALALLSACGAKTGLRVLDAGNATVTSVCQCGMCGNQPFCINKSTGEFIRWGTGCDIATQLPSAQLSIFDRNGAQRTVHCVGDTIGGGAVSLAIRIRADLTIRGG